MGLNQDYPRAIMVGMRWNASWKCCAESAKQHLLSLTWLHPAWTIELVLTNLQHQNNTRWVQPGSILHELANVQQEQVERNVLTRHWHCHCPSSPWNEMACGSSEDQNRTFCLLTTSSKFKCAASANQTLLIILNPISKCHFLCLSWTVGLGNTVILYGHEFKSTFQYSLHRSSGYSQSWCNLPCWLTVASLLSHSDSVHALQIQAGHVYFATPSHHY